MHDEAQMPFGGVKGGGMGRFGGKAGVAAWFTDLRWNTPKKPSVSIRRFDTRFFVAALPPAKTASNDQKEIPQVTWMRPYDALRAFWEGSMDPSAPQLITLQHMGQFFLGRRDSAPCKGLSASRDSS